MRRTAAVLALAAVIAGPVAAQRGQAQRARAHQARPPHAEAQALLDQGKSAEANELLRGWLRKNPRDAEARLLFSTALFMGGQTQKAIVELDRALELDPDLRQGLTGLLRDVVTGHLNPPLPGGEQAGQQGKQS